MADPKRDPFRVSSDEVDDSDSPEVPTDAERTDAVREAVERSRSGAPAVGSVVRDRFSSDEVFQRIVAAADEEITSGSRELLFSGIAAGFAITITFLLYASLYGSTDGHPILSALLYPLGFVYIIIGGYQLYTENTLPPVALTIERLASVPALLRHWSIVLVGNFLGATIGAAVLAWGGVFSPEAADAALYLGEHGFETAWWDLFFKASFAGLIVAGVVWVAFASRDTISRLVVVYMAFLAIPIGNLFHVVTSFTEMSYAVFVGGHSFVAGLTQFVLPVLLGNTIGGVLLVTVVNYYQTSEERLESARFAGTERRLSIREWALGGIAGRSYVPLIDTTHHGVGADDDCFRVFVPISNPRTESRIVEFAAALASTHDAAVVDVVHIVQVPDRSSVVGGQHERIVEESQSQLESIGEDLGVDGVGYECSTVVTPRSFEGIFNMAEAERSDLLVMTRDTNEMWHAGRAEGALDELTTSLPCDVLVLEDRDLDLSRILLPTAGGPDSDLSAEVAHSLHSATGADVTLLHVVDGPEDRAAGDQFLSRWASDHGLSDAAFEIDDSGDIERAITQRADDYSLLLLGATERGLLRRLVTASLHFDVLDEVDCSVAFAERPTKRTLGERLFGRR